MFVKLALGATIALLLATPAIAAGQSAETATVTADREVICKIQTRPGSLVGRQRSCLTRAQWDEGRRRAQANLVRVQGQDLFINSVMSRPGG